MNRDVLKAKRKKHFLFRFSIHRCSSVFIGGKCRLFFFSLFSVVMLGLSSCAEVAKEIGLDVPTDLEQRAGITGTQAKPASLDPFKQYNLVMAANECRFFTLKVPEHWYWKIYLTAANRKKGQNGRLDAEISPVDPPWEMLPSAVFKKTLSLGQEGVQVILGVGNSAGSRLAFFKLCQEGAPLHITIESQVSSNATLLGPGHKNKKSQGE